MKTVFTVGPKCACGYGLNQGVSLPEQSDIDAKVSAIEAELGEPLDKVSIAKIAIEVRGGNPLWTEKAEKQIRRDQMRQATFVLSYHAREDGSCPGRVTAGEDNVGLGRIVIERAQGKTFAERLEHAERVAAHRQSHRDEKVKTALDEKQVTQSAGLKTRADIEREYDEDTALSLIREHKARERQAKN